MTEMLRQNPYPAMAEEFQGKRVLVTGGTKGAGAAMVRRFLQSGARVCTSARSALPEGQSPTLFVQADLGSSEGIRELAGRVRSFVRPVKALCAKSLPAEPLSSF